MNVVLSMQINAVMLFVIAISCLIIITEDLEIGPLPKIAAAWIGYHAFAQAMWLLGYWLPGAAGYPWSRMGYDSGVLFFAVWRAASVLGLKHRRCRHRRLAMQRQRM